eukprot:g3686.t1
MQLHQPLLGDDANSVSSRPWRTLAGLAGLLLIGASSFAGTTKTLLADPQQESEYIPKDGFEGVVVQKPAPGGLQLIPPESLESVPRAFFLHGNDQRKLLKLQFEAFAFRPHISEGRVYGMKKIRQALGKWVPTPTGNSEDVTEGLLFVANKLEPIQYTVLHIDRVHKYDRRKPNGPIRRGIVQAVQKDGTTHYAYIYYTMQPPKTIAQLTGMEGKNASDLPKVPNQDVKDKHFNVLRPNVDKKAPVTNDEAFLRSQSKTPPTNPPTDPPGGRGGGGGGGQGSTPAPREVSLVASWQNKQLALFADEVVKFFERRPDLHTRGNAFGDNNADPPKISTDISLVWIDRSDPEAHAIADVLVRAVTAGMNQYMKERPLFKEVVPEQSTFVNPIFNIQRYLPGEGFKKWHCDWSTSEDATEPVKRVLAWIIYLNDVPDGGTEFHWQNQYVEAIKGQLTIFPAGMSHVHRGRVSHTQTKYIATGWINVGRMEPYLKRLAEVEGTTSRNRNAPFNNSELDSLKACHLVLVIQPNTILGTVNESSEMICFPLNSTSARAHCTIYRSGYYQGN